MSYVFGWVGTDTGHKIPVSPRVRRTPPPILIVNLQTSNSYLLKIVCNFVRLIAIRPLLQIIQTQETVSQLLESSS